MREILTALTVAIAAYATTETIMGGSVPRALRTATACLLAYVTTRIIL